ncbi:MAG: polysaccharide ABC transporter ATP-binding protein [Verrucomicrobiota bacterium]
MIAVSIEQVSKVYRLGKLDRSVLFREIRTAAKRGLARISGRPFAGDPEEEKRKFWALKNINFSVAEGETLGIIGANGAGKSTLLKLVSRITAPTEGRIRIRGRMGSLLEVGTGFHGELTGRENVYLNGAILGMKSAEVSGKFDDIVSFSGLEEFIDTPVKRYSSGMYVRLAFSVAAFLEPEILVLDEVLAVGDQRFQNRCTDRIETLINDGRTIIFVSHNASLVEKICKRAVWMKRGEMVMDGPASEVLAKYAELPTAEEEQALASEAVREWGRDHKRAGDAEARILRARVLNGEGKPTTVVKCSETLGVEIIFQVLGKDTRVAPTLHVFGAPEHLLFVSHAREVPVSPPGEYRAFVEIPRDLMSPGPLTLGLALNTLQPFLKHAFLNPAFSIRILDDFGESSLRQGFGGDWPGVVRPKLDWTVEAL